MIEPRGRCIVSDVSCAAFILYTSTSPAVANRECRVLKVCPVVVSIKQYWMGNYGHAVAEGPPTTGGGGGGGILFQ